jgi:hypothetical protein
MRRRRHRSLRHGEERKSSTSTNVNTLSARLHYYTGATTVAARYGLQSRAAASMSVHTSLVRQQCQYKIFRHLHCSLTRVSPAEAKPRYLYHKSQHNQLQDDANSATMHTSFETTVISDISCPPQYGAMLTTSAGKTSSPRFRVS